MLSQIELLKKYNLRIRGHLGQHLLMDPNTIRKIVDALELQSGDRVFEIGPGLGAVTREVLRRGFPLLAVEKDKKFVEVLTGELAPEYPGRFTLVHGDILKCDLTQLIKEWMSEKGSPSPAKVKGIGNLPYYIGTPILFHLIEHAKVFSRAVFMLQKEVAARLTARPGSDDYSRLSVTSRFYGETEFLFDVSPSCFLPPPEVISRVISFAFRPFSSPPGVWNEARLLKLVRVAFSQRRKTLLSLLAQGLGSKHDRKDLERIFAEFGLSPKVRGESLSLEQFILLAGALERREGTGNIPQGER